MQFPPGMEQIDRRANQKFSVKEISQGSKSKPKKGQRLEEQVLATFTRSHGLPLPISTRRTRLENGQQKRFPEPRQDEQKQLDRENRKQKTNLPSGIVYEERIKSWATIFQKFKNIID